MSLSLKALIREWLIKTPHFKRQIEQIEAEREKQAAIEEIEFAKRYVRGKVCKDKILERIKKRNILISAREKRARRAERVREISGIAKKVRSAGIVEDTSDFNDLHFENKRPYPDGAKTFFEHRMNLSFRRIKPG